MNVDGSKEFVVVVISLVHFVEVHVCIDYDIISVGCNIANPAFWLIPAFRQLYQKNVN